MVGVAFAGRTVVLTDSPTVDTGADDTSLDDEPPSPENMKNAPTPTRSTTATMRAAIKPRLVDCSEAGPEEGSDGPGGGGGRRPSFMAEL